MRLGTHRLQNSEYSFEMVSHTKAKQHELSCSLENGACTGFSDQKRSTFSDAGEKKSVEFGGVFTEVKNRI